MAALFSFGTMQTGHVHLSSDVACVFISTLASGFGSGFEIGDAVGGFPKEKPPAAGAPPKVNPEEVIAPPTTGFGAGFSDGGRPAIKDKQR